MLFYILMEKIPLDTISGLNHAFDLYHSSADKVIGLIQISHGMAEHKVRYLSLINFLNQHGYHVAIYDHRGHGDRIIDNKIGFFDKFAGWELVVTDLLKVHKETNRLFPKLPKILLGHSMGSWIALSALQKKTMFNAALISGSNYPNKPESILHKILLKFEMLRLGREGYSKFLHKVIFGGFNSRFKDAMTSNDWLSRDKLSVENYTKDPLCGFIVSNQLWADVIYGIESVFKIENLELLNKSIPFLVFSGTHDPVSNMGKGAIRLNECLKLHGCKSELYLVEGARHEALNETNKMTTYNYILDFLEKKLHGV
jgi:alpha-beta hydrolase superfamily lysophospholipase